MAKLAIAYNSIEFSLSTIIGEIISRSSALALPAYARLRPIKIPIFWLCFVALSSLSCSKAKAASASFLIPLFKIPKAR
jgi:hypothetical protein